MSRVPAVPAVAAGWLTATYFPSGQIESLSRSVRWMILKLCRYIFISAWSLSYRGFTSTMIYTVRVAMKTLIWQQR